MTLFPDLDFGLHVRSMEQPPTPNPANVLTSGNYQDQVALSRLERNDFYMKVWIRIIWSMFSIVFISIWCVILVVFKGPVLDQTANGTVGHNRTGYDGFVKIGSMGNFTYPNGTSASEMECILPRMYGPATNATMQLDGFGMNGSMKNASYPNESFNSNLKSTTAEMRPQVINATVQYGGFVRNGSIKNVTHPNRILAFKLESSSSEMVGPFLGESILQCDNTTLTFIVDTDAKASLFPPSYGAQDRKSILKLKRRCFYLPKGIKKLNANFTAKKMSKELRLDPSYSFLLREQI